MLYHQQGEETKSISDLSRVLQLDPNNIQALLTRSDAYINLRDYGHALSDVNSGIRMTKDPVFFLGRAEVMVATGHRAEAIRDFRYVITHSREPELRKAAEAGLEELVHSSSP